MGPRRAIGKQQCAPVAISSVNAYKQCQCVSDGPPQQCLAVFSTGSAKQLTKHICGREIGGPTLTNIS
jgi:hypothetical protein